ncbi:Crp/Fnr family transcriptional regulator [Qipengyuania sp. GH38]|nr:Crp/Fnr family transcriptional regulator [Qipengyuania intermedia]
MALSSELKRFPMTGLFLEGRLRHDLSEEERVELESLVSRVEIHPDGHRLISRGDICDHSTMLIDGFMLRTLDSGDRRYGVSFHVPGDFVDLHCFALKRLDHNIECVGQAKVGLVPHERIAEVMKEKPHLARLFWFSTLLDAAMHREWIMKLEQLKVPQRIAHIFAEVWCRLDMVGLAFEDGFDTPLTQADLADMCGATPIHVNRAIGELRKSGIADFNRGEVRICNREKLENFAHFEKDYLYGDGALSLRQDGL